MKRSLATKTLILTAAGALIGYGGYWLGANRSPGGSGGHGDRSAPATASPSDPGRRVLYWHDPMVPGKRFDKPGKSPFMDMQLVPVYADGGETTGVRISPTLQQNLGIRFATVRREVVTESLDLVGTTQFDASREEVIQSRTAGYIDRLHVRTPLQQIKRGQSVASVFVPEWIAPPGGVSCAQTGRRHSACLRRSPAHARTLDPRLSCRGAGAYRACADAPAAHLPRFRGRQRTRGA